jgi:hypothetical protein
MNRKIARLRRSLEELRRRGGVRAEELERLASALGRRRHPRGKEPTWVSTVLPHSRPLSIPRHSGDLNRFTVRTILDQLEADIDALDALEDEGIG